MENLLKKREKNKIPSIPGIDKTVSLLDSNEQEVDDEFLRLEKMYNSFLKENLASDQFYRYALDKNMMIKNFVFHDKFLDLFETNPKLANLIIFNSYDSRFSVENVLNKMINKKKYLGAKNMLDVILEIHQKTTKDKKSIDSMTGLNYQDFIAMSLFKEIATQKEIKIVEVYKKMNDTFPNSEMTERIYYQVIMEEVNKQKEAWFDEKGISVLKKIKEIHPNLIAEKDFYMNVIHQEPYDKWKREKFEAYKECYLIEKEKIIKPYHRVKTL